MANYTTSGIAGLAKRNNKTKAGTGGGLIFALIGLLFFGIGAYNIIHNVNFALSNEKVVGQVIKIVSTYDSDGTKYAPIVQFTDKSGGSFSFKHSISSGSNSYNIGEAVDVVYSANNPSDAKINSFFSLYGFFLIFAVTGGLSASIGMAIIYAVLKRKKDIKFLSAHGHKIKAEVSNVDLHKVDKGRDYWTVNAQWHDQNSNKLYHFSSDPIYINPEKYVTGEINVIIDPANPKKYLVDLNSLPEIIS